MVANAQENWDKPVSEFDSQKMQTDTTAVETAPPVYEKPQVAEVGIPKFRYRVLVVDDEPSIRELVGVFLEREGYEVLTAADGFYGLQALDKSLPDVVISDLHMPRMSGFEFLAVVRKRFPSVATVAMSGDYITADDASHILADAFFQKGNFNIADLFREVAKLIANPPVRPEREKGEIAPLLAPGSAASDHASPQATASQQG